MIENADIAPGAITEPKLSKNFRLKLTNVEKGADGQIPVVQSDGSMAYKSVGGDATLDSSGNFTVTTSTSSTGETTQGATGATGEAGAAGATGAQGATGAAGSDANVTAENVDGALGFTGSTAGLVKRTADNTFALDTATYSTTGHTHDDRYYTETEADTLLATKSGTGHTHDDRYYTETEADTLLATKAASSHTHAHADLTSIDANQHLDWTTDRGSTNIHAGNLNLQGVTEEVVDSGADYMVFLDGGATGAAKKESLADLVTKISGDGTSAADDEIRLTASSGILSLYASDLRSQSKIKYVKDITWETNATGVSFSTTTTPTGDESTAVCTITHNLNTKYILVSVIEFSTTESGGDTNFVENLGEQIDMNYDLTVKPTNDNNIELYANRSGFIYAGSVFKVAIMG